MHLIRCDATARMKPTRISGKFKFNLTTVVHCAIYLENWTAPVQPPPPPPPFQINKFYISLEASHDTNISKYYSHTSTHVYHIYQRKF